MAKRFRLEVGFLGMVFIFLLLVCLFLWMFVLGVWFGQRMMGKGPSPVAERTLKVPEEAPAPEEVSPPEVMVSKPVSPGPTVVSETPPQVEKESSPGESPAVSPPVKERPAERVPEKEERVSPAAREKIRPPYYTLQVASFKDPKEAEKYARYFRERGYFSQVVRVNLPRKGLWFRVYVGRFATLEEARKTFEELKRKKLIKQAYIKKVEK